MKRRLTAAEKAIGAQSLLAAQAQYLQWLDVRATLGDVRPADRQAMNALAKAVEGLQAALRPFSEPGSDARTVLVFRLQDRGAERLWSDAHDRLGDLDKFLGFLRLAATDRPAAGVYALPTAHAWVRMAATAWFAALRHVPGVSKNGNGPFYVALHVFENDAAHDARVPPVSPDLVAAAVTDWKKYELPFLQK